MSKLREFWNKLIGIEPLFTPPPVVEEKPAKKPRTTKKASSEKPTKKPTTGTKRSIKKK